MKWFKHESDAHANIKLQSVIDQIGIAGFGYYWACVELVASQGENYRIKREKRWIEYFKKILNVEIEDQQKFLAIFARIDLIDKASVKKGELYIPKLAERSDEYTEKKKRRDEQRRVSRHNPDNVGVEQKRTEENREEEKPVATLEYLSQIPETDMQEFLKRFNASEQGIKSKAEDLKLWCQSNKKKKKNYRAFLLVALKKDFPERKKIIKTVEETRPQTPEDQEAVKKSLVNIRKDLQKKGVLKK